MNHRLLSALGLLAALTAAGPAHAALKIVATTPDLAALAAAVAGDGAEVTAMAAETQDPHYVDARPNLVLPLSRADLLVVNGLGLEIGWLPSLLANARNARIQIGAPGHLDASAHVTRLGVERADRAKGDIHPGGNPHFMHDPRSAAAVATALGERMAALDGDGAAGYRARATSLAKKLRYLAQRERDRFAQLPAERRRVVAYHASLVYLLDWLGLEPVATVEPKPGVAPDPAHVAAVLKTMKRTGAKVIVQEPYYPRKTSETLAKLAKGDVAVIPGGARFRQGERYLARVLRTSKVLHAALSH